jgi:hypothetical protein
VVSCGLGASGCGYGTVAGSCDDGSKTPGFYKRQGIS